MSAGERVLSPLRLLDRVSRGEEMRIIGKRMRIATLMLVLAASVPSTLHAAAQPDAAGSWLMSAIDMLERGNAPVLSINDAASRAQDRFGGQVISITPAQQEGQRGYRVKVLLESGRVKTLFVEERTGVVIDRRQDD